MTPPRIALLLKAPRPGEVKTRLAASVGEAGAVEIYRRLAERQLRALPAGWPVTVHHAPAEAGPEIRQWLDQHRAGLDYRPQGEGDLGARLTLAFAAGFAHDAPAVLAIGGDCPALDGVLLQAAAQALANADVVLGPAVDGGYYLIGLRAPCPALFAGIPWSTDAVLAETRGRIRRQKLTVLDLPVLEDVDDATSWLRAGAMMRSSSS